MRYLAITRSKQLINEEKKVSVILLPDAELVFLGFFFPLSYELTQRQHSSLLRSCFFLVCVAHFVLPFVLTLTFIIFSLLR